MTGGYTGNILRVNLTTKAISTLDTAKYEEFGGGLGIGTAIFWDLAVANSDWDLQDGFDPRNVVSMISGPLAATGIPGSGRCSVSGLAPSTYPISWFWRTNLGGRFATMLKLAGWDGVVIEGKSDKPVWINIINDKVTIEDGKSLWGLNTWETQDSIVSLVAGGIRFGREWEKIGDTYTTARPQIVCIGPAGEAQTRVASLVHGSGIAGRNGGFGGVFGSKNLKAISVIGTGSLKVADPKAVVDARLYLMQNYPVAMDSAMSPLLGSSACMPCTHNDRKRNSTYGGESICADSMWYMKGFGNPASMVAAEILQKWGVSSWGTAFGGAFNVDIPGAPDIFNKQVPDAPGLGWLIKKLYDIGALGPGEQVDSAPLDMTQWDQVQFREAFCSAIASRTGIGSALAEGTLRAEKMWGRLDEDSNSGLLRFPAWGSVFHWTLPAVEWAYSALIGAGDPVWHAFGNRLGPGAMMGPPKAYTIDQALEIITAKTIPYTGDPYMFSYSWKGDEARATGIYSDHKAKEVAWSRHYAVFWGESMAFCDTVLPEMFNDLRPDFKGATPDVEPLLFNAVTGKNITFADSMETGRKIWNLKRAIRVLQGRERNTEKFFPFMYMPGAAHNSEQGGLPVYENGKWSYQVLNDMYLDNDGVEFWKTNYYNLEGWNADTGWPTRKTLEGLNLKSVADTLEQRGKLGTA